MAPGVDRCLLGPVCVATTRRGSGLFADLYRALATSDDLAALDEGVTVIERGNVASLRAHLKLPGADECGAYDDDDGARWAVVRVDLRAARAAWGD